MAYPLLKRQNMRQTLALLGMVLGFNLLASSALASDSVAVQEASVVETSSVAELARGPTGATMVPRWSVSGHEQLASVCAENPASSVRVYNPLVLDEFTDVSCSAVLDGKELDDKVIPGTDERIGEARQPWSPLGLACALLAAAANRFIDSRCETPECHGSNDWGSAGIGLLCAFF